MRTARLTALLPVLVLLMFAWNAAGLARAEDRKPRPSILFAIPDDWGRHAGAYDTPVVTTPTFDRLAKEGVQTWLPRAKTKGRDVQS